MGLIAQCDGGCGATTDDIKAFVGFGIVKKVWYCEKCKDRLSDLYALRDTLHTQYAGVLTNALLFSVDEFIKANPKSRLPDAPE